MSLPPNAAHHMMMQPCDIEAVYECGGSIRDGFLGIPNQDRDYAVDAPSVGHLVHWLEVNGGEIRKVTELLTVRATMPPEFPLNNWDTAQTIDFAVLRTDGPSTDGRHPDNPVVGTRLQDQARRDFTCNSLLRNVITGELHDPFNGQQDIANKILRFVGDPLDRIKEDALRLLRAWRFVVTKGFTPTVETWDAMCSIEAANLLTTDSRVSTDRIRDEITPMFRKNTAVAIEVFSSMPDYLWDAIFPADGPLWLMPTTKEGHGK